ncbi:hypothetical protein BLOT_013015 [Blomia tropicalis]|nr:hypothetical protein BLOT_013015 [Blomia tropicalis]
MSLHATPGSVCVYHLGSGTIMVYASSMATTIRRAIITTIRISNDNIIPRLHSFLKKKSGSYGPLLTFYNK